MSAQRHSLDVMRAYIYVSDSTTDAVHLLVNCPSTSPDGAAKEQGRLMQFQTAKELALDYVLTLFPRTPVTLVTPEGEQSEIVRDPVPGED